jgi:uncharacterized protein
MAADIRSLAATIAAEINSRPDQAKAAIELLDEGATVPFIARYRKEVTGGLDDGQLRTLAERLVYLRELEARRAAIVESITGQGKMTDELMGKIAKVATKAELEDLYLPYKPKRRTRAEIARERGLAPLADTILADRTKEPAVLAEGFITADVPDVKAALEGARDIIAEGITENADLLGKLRGHMKTTAILKATVVDGKQEAGAKFSDYFSHQERWATAPGHRALAMLRGWNEEVLTLTIDVDVDAISPNKPVERLIATAYEIGPSRPGDRWLMEVASWTWRVKLSMSLSLDLMRELRERAEEEAIHVFARNLKDLLLAAPAGSRATMGLDPGIRTGVKVAVVDGTGKLLETTTVYPFPPKNDVRGTQATLAALVRKHKVELISIGNGTGSRETEKLVADMLADLPAPKPTKVIVSEAGASVYSASETAALEFPGLDVSLRGAVSIARRLQEAVAFAGRGRRGRGECRRCRSEHGFRSAAGPCLGPRPVDRRCDRQASRRRGGLRDPPRSVEGCPPRPAHLRAMRRLPAHSQRQGAARFLVGASGSLWHRQEDRCRLRTRPAQPDGRYGKAEGPRSQAVHRREIRSADRARHHFRA